MTLGKKGRTLIYFIILLVTISSCGKRQNNIMYIEKAELTKEEQNILRLTEEETNWQVFDYTVDESIQSVHIVSYYLDDSQNWKKESSSSAAVEAQDGRIFISSSEKDQQQKIGFQSGGGNVSTWIFSNEENERNETTVSTTTAWNSSANIIPEEEIPLFIQFTSNSAEIVTYSTESFFDTEKLKGYESVKAITIIFLKEPLS